MATESCARCGSTNDDGASFCARCGASLAEQIHCPSCNTLNPLGRGFCTRCGGSLEHAGWGEPAQPGAVIDGTWERGDDEVIRRVEPEEARRFLGARTVRVPAGAVGVVLVDGVVERVLPPGERTSVSLFDRVANFFTGRERTAFYLVDQRPFLVPFVIRTRASSGGQVIKTQVLATFTLPKGNRDALAQFIANVVRERPSVATGDLYNLLRPDVVRIAQDTLERANAAGDVSYPDVEAEIRRQLADALGGRYGLTVDATVAPLTAIASVTLRLGAGAAPATRACSKCGAELPSSLKFCDRCGEKQPLVAIGGPASADAPLYTRDDQQVELDVVVRVSGQSDDFSPERIAPAIAAAAAVHLRGAAFTALTAPGGLAALERALVAAAGDALAGLGLTLAALSIVDLRSKTGQWLLGAHAELDRAREELEVATDWLAQRDDELDLEQLAIARVLRAEQQRRDHQFAREQAAVDDRERRDPLAARHAELDVAKARRDGAVTTARDDVDRERQRAQLAHATTQRHAQVEAELAELRARGETDLALTERRKRLELELSALAEQQQLAKLRAMAEIDRATAAQDHAHELENRAALRGLSPDEMIAMQAGELAKGEGGGAAWANALAARAADERRHAEDVRGVYERAMTAMAEVAGAKAQPAPVIAAVAPAPVATTMPATTTLTPATKPCPTCRAAIKADARFCGACGATVP